MRHAPFAQRKGRERAKRISRGMPGAAERWGKRPQDKEGSHTQFRQQTTQHLPASFKIIGNYIADYNTSRI